MFRIYQALNNQLSEAFNSAFAKEALAALEAGESLNPQLMPASSHRHQTLYFCTLH